MIDRERSLFELKDDEDDADGVLIDPREIPAKTLPMWALLVDGEPHRPQELIESLPRTKDGSLKSYASLKQNLTAIRKVVRRRGLDILVRFIDQRLYYQLVRLIRYKSE